VLEKFRLAPNSNQRKQWGVVYGKTTQDHPYRNDPQQLLKVEQSNTGTWAIMACFYTRREAQESAHRYEVSNRFWHFLPKKFNFHKDNPWRSF